MRSIRDSIIIVLVVLASAPVGALAQDTVSFRLDADTDLMGVADRKSYENGLVSEWLIQHGAQVNDAKLRLDQPWCSLEKMIFPRDPSPLSAGGPQTFDVRPGSKPAAQKGSVLAFRVYFGSGSEQFRLECHNVTSVEDISNLVLKSRGRLRRPEAAQALADQGRKNLAEGGGFVDFASMAKTYNATGAGSP